MLGSVEAFTFYLLNGLTFEFGDDLLCYVRQEAFGASMPVCRAELVRYLGQLGINEPYAALAGTLVGYAITPLSVLLSAILGRAKTAGEAFGRGLVLELIEGALSVVGQVITDGVLQTALWSLGLSAVIAPVRGGVAAFTFAWLRSGFFRLAVILLVLGAGAFGLHRIGVLPL